MSQPSEKNLEVIKSSQNASIPSLQELPEEQKKRKTQKSQLQVSQKSQNKHLNNHSEIQEDFTNINMSSAARKKINMDTQITPGYKKFVIDENNAAYDCIKGMFTREEIEEAFKTLDYKENNQITSEELTFFLEYIGEKATEEEIEEMIKMCDLEGNGYVTKDEFIKLASGQSLAPIGQSYPPSEELLQKQEIMNNLKLEDLQLQKYRSPNSNQIQKNGKKDKAESIINIKSTNKQNFSNNENQQIQTNNFTGMTFFSKPGISNFNTNNNISQFNNQPQSQKVVTNIINNTSGSQLGEAILTKKAIENKKKKLLKWQKDYGINQQKIKNVTEMLNKVKQLYLDQNYGQENSESDALDKIANIYYKSYRDFLGVFSLQDSQIHQEIFNICKIQYQQQLQQKNNNDEDYVNLQEFIIMLIGSMDIKSIGKYDLAFDIIGKDAIDLEDLLYIERTLTFKNEIADTKIEEKFKNHRHKKEYLNKTYGTKQMDKQLYYDIVSSYPTYFQA